MYLRVKICNIVKCYILPINTDHDFGSAYSLLHVKHYTYLYLPVNHILDN